MVDLNTKGSNGTATSPVFAIGAPKESPSLKRASTTASGTEGRETPPSFTIGEGAAKLAPSTDLPDKEADPYLNGAANGKATNGQATPVIAINGVVGSESSSAHNDIGKLCKNVRGVGWGMEGP